MRIYQSLSLLTLVISQYNQRCHFGTFFTDIRHLCGRWLPITFTHTHITYTNVSLSLHNTLTCKWRCMAESFSFVRAIVVRNFDESKKLWHLRWTLFESKLFASFTDCSQCNRSIHIYCQSLAQIFYVSIECIWLKIAQIHSVHRMFWMSSQRNNLGYF